VTLQALIPDGFQRGNGAFPIQARWSSAIWIALLPFLSTLGIANIQPAIPHPCQRNRLGWGRGAVHCPQVQGSCGCHIRRRWFLEERMSIGTRTMRHPDHYCIWVSLCRVPPMGNHYGYQPHGQHSWTPWLGIWRFSVLGCVRQARPPCVLGVVYAVLLAYLVASASPTHGNEGAACWISFVQMPETIFPHHTILGPPCIGLEHP